MAAIATLSVSAQSVSPPPNLDDLLIRIGNRIEAFYKRAQNLMCQEKVTAQPLRWDLSFDGFARVLEYDLRVEMAAVDDLGDGSDADNEASDANFVRQLRKVNGRAPRERDLNDRNTCLDPNPLTPEPLAFLLAKNRGEFAFRWVGFGKGKDQHLMLIDYSPIKKEKAEFVPDKRGRDGCFSISLPVEKKRVWVDSQTFDVVRLEEHLSSKVDIHVPTSQQRRTLLPDVIVVDRYDLVTQYKPVAFQDPDETLLLPASIDQLAVLHGAQSNRRTQVFTNYKRFLTEGRIIKPQN